MLSKYLHLVLSVEQIGYCQRISESAVQYAERLLSTKESLPEPAAEIARKLVHEYKDHSFVIDIEEAQRVLGKTWIIGASPELMFIEHVYTMLYYSNVFLSIFREKHLQITGSLQNPNSIFILENDD